MKSRERTLHKGEVLYSSGETPGSVYLLRSGLVSIGTQLARPPQLVGEESLVGRGTRRYTATAKNSTVLTEFDAREVLRTFSEIAPPLKMLARSLIKKLGRLNEELDPQMNPARIVARTLTVLSRAAFETGEREGESATVVWAAFRKYCHWGLGESPAQIERILKILTSQEWATLEYVPDPTDPDGEMELGKICFLSLSRLESLSKFSVQIAKHGAEVTLATFSKNPDLAKFQAIYASALGEPDSG